MSWRMASNTTLNCASYFLSKSLNFRARCAFDASICRSQTKVRIISLFTCTGLLLRSTLECLATRCSVKANGGWRRPPQSELDIAVYDFKFKVTICDLHPAACGHSLGRSLILQRENFSLFLLSGRWRLSVPRRASMDSRRYSRPYRIVPCRRMRPFVSKHFLLWRHRGYRLRVF